MMSAADVQESPGQPSAKSSGSLFRIATPCTCKRPRSSSCAKSPCQKPSEQACTSICLNAVDVRLQRDVKAGTVPLQAALFSSAIVLHDRVHEGDVQRDRPSGTVEQHAKPAARSTEPENDSLLAAQTRSSRFANDYTLTHGPVVERTFTGACHFECPRTLPVRIPTTPKETRS